MVIDNVKDMRSMNDMNDMNTSVYINVYGSFSFGWLNYVTAELMC